ncbi:MAG TPA: SpoIIE family protein phosphatase [Terriglobia bacterium]|nr:SpoIIE family protein phosphatase [Terriglobia bacterium]
MKGKHEQWPCIVLVDDEELVLSTLRILLEMNGDFRVMSFTDPIRAIEELERTPVDVVISDFMMPVMNGLDLLKKVRSLQPEAMLIMLTGYADKQNAIRALNEANLYQYLEKPWDNDQMLIVLRNALQEKSLRQQLIEKVRTLDRLILEHSELAERQTQLENELEMAARVQQSLLPDCFPQIRGLQIDSFYRPCQAIGGDYLDFVRQDGQTWILISDVSGHGVQAALVNMLMKAIFQDTAPVVEDPAHLFAEMNARLNRFLPEGTYAAAAALCVDEKTATMRLVNAGLPFPLVMRPSEPRLDVIVLPGIPLGMFSGAGLNAYEVRRIDMVLGDVLLVASDGLSEMQGENGEFFGDRHLFHTLQGLYGMSGKEVLSNLVEKADRFRGGRRATDDVAIVAVTRTPHEPVI